MKLTIDTDNHTLTTECEGRSDTQPLYSTAAFETISRYWLKVGWNQKYPYTFSWLGRPIIQLPEDMIRAQEVVWRVRPNVIIETGVAHGGSLIYYASLLKAIGQGRVIGIDIEIRPHNRKAIEEHPLSEWITLLEGDSADPEIVRQARDLIDPEDTVLIVLDSCHTLEHVRRELDAWHDLVTPDSYLVATDGIMRDLHDVPRGDRRWRDDHPAAAAEEFVQRNAQFVLEQPPWPFNESPLTENITHWPSAWLRRIAA